MFSYSDFQKESDPVQRALMEEVKWFGSLNLTFGAHCSPNDDSCAIFSMKWQLWKHLLALSCQWHRLKYCVTHTLFGGREKEMSLVILKATWEVHRLIRLTLQTTAEERIGAQPEWINLNIKKIEAPVVWNIFHDLLQLLMKRFFFYKII